MALKWTLITSPGADELWTLGASNYIATNAALIILTATNDVGLYTNVTVTLNPVTRLGIIGAVSKAQCNLQLSVIPGNTYVVQVSTNLLNGWTDLALVVPTNTPIFFVDTNPASGSRFYRLRGP
jgi:hypothetical protein